jgi:hypothetical protein
MRSYSTSEEIQCLVMELEGLLQCSLIPIVSQINPLHTFTCSLFRVHSAIILQSKTVFFSNPSFLFRFLGYNFVFLIYHMSRTCRTEPILHALITLS